MFNYAHASDHDWRTAAKSCVDQLRAGSLFSTPESGSVDAGIGGSRLGFLYVTDTLASSLAELVAYLKSETGIGNWVGTVGIGVCSVGVEYFDRPAIVILSCQFPAQSFRVFDTVASSFDDFRAKHGEWCERASPYFGVVHGDPTNTAVAELVASLSHRLNGAYIVGGPAIATTPWLGSRPTRFRTR